MRLEARKLRDFAEIRNAILCLVHPRGGHAIWNRHRDVVVDDGERAQGQTGDLRPRDGDYGPIGKFFALNAVLPRGSRSVSVHELPAIGPSGCAIREPQGHQGPRSEGCPARGYPVRRFAAYPHRNLKLWASGQTLKRLSCSAVFVQPADYRLMRPMLKGPQKSGPSRRLPASTR